MQEVWQILGVELESQLPAAKNIPRNELQLTTILNSVYAVMGLVAVITIIYNAVQYLTSQGDPGVTKKATQGLIFAVIGLAIVLLATVITNFIFTTIGGAG